MPSTHPATCMRTMERSTGSTHCKRMKTTPRIICSSIEALEARIAPASVLTYTDIDGDKVTIKSSKGDLSGRATFSDGADGQLRLLDLSDPSFAGTNITFKVVKAGGGDGLAAVGRINGGTNDLGSIVIKGDLGDIDTGSDTNGKAAIKSLTAHSMGRYGLATQGGSGDLSSFIFGSLGSLKVAKDVNGAFINVFGGTNATIGSVKIGGSLIGGEVASSGFIYADGGIGSVKIAGDVIGGSGAQSGSIGTDGKLGNVTIGGSLFGSNGPTSGLIVATGDVGAVKIRGDLKGGEGVQSAAVRSDSGGIKSVTIGGSLTGGDGGASGAIVSQLNLGKVKVDGNLQGGAGPSSGFIGSTAGVIDSLKIGGSVIGGSASSTGNIRAEEGIRTLQIAGDLLGGAGGSSGTIGVPGDVARLTIGGSVIGGSGILSGSIMLDRGRIESLRIGHDLQGGSGISSGTVMGYIGDLGSVTIGGSIFGGSQTGSGSIELGEGNIGKVKIGGDLRGGSITGGDVSTVGSAHIYADRIGSVVIGGSVIAGSDDGTGGMGMNASITANLDIGSITVRGDVIGSSGAGGDLVRPVFSARGQASPGATSDLAIGKITIGGNVERAQILAGYSHLTPVNGNAQIGSVIVRGDWIASNLVAGVQDGGAPGFGDTGDTIIAGGTGIAKIASIQIDGAIVGTPFAGDRFGFVSGSIDRFKAGVKLIAIPAAPGFISLSPLTHDVNVRQI